MRVERRSQGPWKPGGQDAPERVAVFPDCGATGLRILYGMPSNPEPPEGCVWGGCVIGVDDPDYACSKCENTWRHESEAN